ncbi:MAG: hypothetical protein ACRBHB_21975 [Arenicella sp.]
MSYKFYMSVVLVALLSACVTVVGPEPQPEPEPEPAPKKAVVKKSRISQACYSKLARFKELGVDTSNINVILERGLKKSDFIGSVQNEAFQVLAEARELKCRY